LRRGAAPGLPRDRPVTIETLFLDAGGVVVHPNWPRVAERLAAHGVAVGADALLAADLRAKRTLDLPENSRPPSDDVRVAQYFDAVRCEAGIPDSPGARRGFEELRRYHAAHNLWEWVPGDVRPALARLRATVPRLVMVSNANGTLHASMDRLGLAPYFDLLLDSAVERVEKPDPVIFQRALDRSGARPETTVHVGDLYYVDVAGARAAGLAAWLFDPGDLYGGFDCPRVRSLDELAERVEATRDGRGRAGTAP